MTANNIVEIIKNKHGEYEIDNAHKELEKFIDKMTDDEKKSMLVRLVYSVDILLSDIDEEAGLC